MDIKILRLIIGLFMTITLTLAQAEPQQEIVSKVLPDYVIWDHTKSDANSVVRQKALAMKFPLLVEDKHDIEALKGKYEAEQGCVGLAAPQIGISKRFIIFEVPDNPDWKKWRKDLVQTMPRSIWLNPSYKPLSDEMHEDYEACFTIAGIAGPVRRYKEIEYKAYDITGNLITGIAEGFLARAIQHEVDHLDGVLYTDHVEKERLLSLEEYKEKRKKAMEATQQQEQQVN